MKKGFSTIMSAQFFSSLADNALFVAAVELIRAGGGPEWQRAALVPMFALFYVILAPFVGAFARQNNLSRQSIACGTNNRPTQPFPICKTAGQRSRMAESFTCWKWIHGSNGLRRCKQ